MASDDRAAEQDGRQQQQGGGERGGFPLPRRRGRVVRTEMTVADARHCRRRPGNLMGMIGWGSFGFGLQTFGRRVGGATSKTVWK